jgi:Putative zinc-binding metallo-peptidase
VKHGAAGPVRRHDPAARPRKRRIPRQPTRRRLPPDWPAWPDEQLLDVRLCDLDLGIEGTPLEQRIHQLHRELEERRVRFRPYFWLSDDWFTPDGVSGTAIPFYMAHPRLARLEEAQMLEVEGGTPEWCMRILRHETGHAIENAYALRRRRRRIALFGKSSQPYPKFYTPRPYSKRYVLHLEPWYAQSHPDEDFAETFAVWLNPLSLWEKRYAGWPALRKLRYVDELMTEVGPQKPSTTSRRRVEPLAGLRKTLREHYEEARRYYGVDTPNIYDRDLRRLFSDAPEFRRNMSAARFIARIRREVRAIAARWTGEYQYTIKQVIDHIIERCRALSLRLTTPEEQAKIDFTAFVVVQTMNYIHGGEHRVWL